MAKKKLEKINVAIVGVGNCANSLYQGLTYYAGYTGGKEREGVMQSRIGEYAVDNINVVAAFDVDKRKVGKCFREAHGRSYGTKLSFCHLKCFINFWFFHPSVFREARCIRHYCQRACLFLL